MASTPDRHAADRRSAGPVTAESVPGESVGVGDDANVDGLIFTGRRGVCGMVEVSLAMVEQDGHWLLQLRDDLEWIVAPGCWGLFGGHLEPGETPEQALRRELLEEISWQAGNVTYKFQHRNAERVLHFFSAHLLDPLESLCLLEGQDVVLAAAEDLRTGSIWSPALREFRPLAPSLQLALAHLDDVGL